MPIRKIPLVGLPGRSAIKVSPISVSKEIFLVCFPDTCHFLYGYFAHVKSEKWSGDRVQMHKIPKSEVSATLKKTVAPVGGVTA
jgi:hypothetical protein